MAPRSPKKDEEPTTTDAADAAPTVNANAKPAEAAKRHPDGIAGPGSRDGITVGAPVVPEHKDHEQVANDEFGRSMAVGSAR